MRGVSTAVFAVLVIALLVSPAALFASSAAGARGDLEPGAEPSSPIKIATGPDSGADGYLEVSPDEYGSFGAFGVVNGITEDRFKPTGLTLQQTTFTSGFFLFVQDVTLQQELLSDIQEWQDILLAAPGLDREITAANVASDTNGDSVDDTLTSSFRVFNTDADETDLAFDLVQTALPLSGGVAQLRQDYTITNNGSVARSFELVRNFDGDLLWDSDFSNDEVGTTMNGAGLGTYVYEQEANIPGTTAVTLSSNSANAYYGGKNGIEPPLGPPAYGFGTDVQVWENLGYPTSWVNHIAGVGYDTNGDSGEFPPGVLEPADGFTGMGWNITLQPGESTSLQLLHTYGQATPGQCLLNADIRSRLLRAGDRVQVRVALKHVRQRTVTTPFRIWLEDRDGNILARTITDPFTIQFGQTMRFLWPLDLPADLEPGRYRVKASVRGMLQGTATDTQSIDITIQP